MGSLGGFENDLNEEWLQEKHVESGELKDWMCKDNISGEDTKWSGDDVYWGQEAEGGDHEGGKIKSRKTLEEKILL